MFMSRYWSGSRFSHDFMLFSSDELAAVAAVAAQDGADRGVVRAADGESVAAGGVPQGPDDVNHESLTRHATESARRWASDVVFPSFVGKYVTYADVCPDPR